MLMPRLDRLSQAGRNTLLTFSAQVNRRRGGCVLVLASRSRQLPAGERDQGGAASA